MDEMESAVKMLIHSIEESTWLYDLAIKSDHLIKTNLLEIELKDVG